MKYFARLNSDMDKKWSKSSNKLSSDASVCSTASLDSSHSSLDVGSEQAIRDFGGKYVTFKRRVAKTIKVDFVCDIDDIEDHWYSSDDFKKFKARDKKLLEEMRSAVALEALEEKLQECTRGLEKEQPEMKRRTNTHKKECWAVVLSQPNFAENADAIAKAYSRSSRASSRDATIVARLDAMAAKEYLNDGMISEAILPSKLLERH
ncbi:hypothetical protein IV203_018026 [Nitzschia inconspicua]|uniref:Uncharacterized protein n=1 Tax=Nitzschia inconspicua TaxID=303405 RepID=A0A9K3M0T1_9STRA|nr:hypothetical protein IV203_018026 [Nitzschia inconspicua]